MQKPIAAIVDLTQVSTLAEIVIIALPFLVLLPVWFVLVGNHIASNALTGAC
jgi:hypothetical protein